MRALTELKEKGWARRVSEASGQRAATWEPSITPPACHELQAVPEEAPESDREVSEADRAILSEWLAAHKAERKRAAVEHALGGSR